MFLLGPVVLAAGCGTGSAPADPLPQVTGRVVLKGKPDLGGRLDGGKVFLRSVADPSHEAVGVIDHDGTFALATPSPGASRAGVAPGEYLVRVEPPIDSREDFRPAPFHAKYLDYQKSGLRVVIPPPGEWTLELDPARK
ncbi:MAG: hypothetical protein C0501_18045 [Isosphaera sp.]|nr:hypothetical protein [Isosphaera sp.]